MLLSIYKKSPLCSLNTRFHHNTFYFSLIQHIILLIIFVSSCDSQILIICFLLRCQDFTIILSTIVFFWYFLLSLFQPIPRYTLLPLCLFLVFPSISISASTNPSLYPPPNHIASSVTCLSLHSYTQTLIHGPLFLFLSSCTSFHILYVNGFINFQLPNSDI